MLESGKHITGLLFLLKVHSAHISPPNYNIIPHKRDQGRVEYMQTVEYTQSLPLPCGGHISLPKIEKCRNKECIKRILKKEVKPTP